MSINTVVIHQPDFFPYLGFFHRFLSADFYISLDHVQFSPAWTARDKIKTQDGWKWLTVSVKKTSQKTAINKVDLSDNDWRITHLNSLKESYKKATYYDEIIHEIEKVYFKDFVLLKDFNMAAIELLMDLLDVRIPWVYSSSLEPTGSKSELMANLSKSVGADYYLSGEGARDYFEPEPFDKASIKVLWQKFHHPEYTQINGDFIPYLSSLDVLFNCGIKGARKVLHSVNNNGV